MSFDTGESRHLLGRGCSNDLPGGAVRLARVRPVTSQGRADLVIVANRLPVDRVTNPDGSNDWRRSPGGLVSALEPVMRANDGAWIGWPGAPDDDLEPFVE